MFSGITIDSCLIALSISSASWFIYPSYFDDNGNLIETQDPYNIINGGKYFRFTFGNHVLTRLITSGYASDEEEYVTPEENQTPEHGGETTGGDGNNE